MKGGKTCQVCQVLVKTGVFRAKQCTALAKCFRPKILKICNLCNFFVNLL